MPEERRVKKSPAPAPPADSGKGKRSADVVTALEENVAVFEPFADGLCEAVRRGGRLLLFGEGRLHLLAQLAAPDIVGRRHRNGMQLPADVLDVSSGDALTIARRVGPFDAMLAVASSCEDPLFAATLEAAKARGAKIFCVCVGRARVEGRVTLALDIPEGRPHYIPGHISLILHFISKLMLAKMAANPLIKPTRLDDGPRRAPLEHSGSGHHPSWAKLQKAPASPRPDETSHRDHRDLREREGRSGPSAASVNSVAPASGSPPPVEVARVAPPVTDWEDVSELVIDLEPDEADLKLVDENADAAAEVAGSRAILEESAKIPPPPVPTDDQGRIRLIQFRCKECREPILADPAEAGERARCPFCGRRVKVPRATGRLYQPAQATLSQGSRQVSLRFSLEECRLSITPAGGAELEGRVEDVTADGIEASLGAAEAKALAIGVTVELRVETPAFLEPLVTTATVERIFAPASASPDGASGRARALLPLDAGATREARAKLARLAELRSGTNQGQSTR